MANSKRVKKGSPPPIYKYMANYSKRPGAHRGRSLSAESAEVTNPRRSLKESGELTGGKNDRKMKIETHPYDDYLNSAEWHEIRNRILLRDGYRCKMCGTGMNLRVHHIRYPVTIGVENDDDLVTLCDMCHASVHAGDIKAKEERREEQQRRQDTLSKWANQAKYQDFLYGGNKNMCNLVMLRKSIEDFRKQTGCTEYISLMNLQMPLGFAHHLLVAELYHLGLMFNEISEATGLPKQTIVRYINKINEVYDHSPGDTIPIEELERMVDHFVLKVKKERGI